MGTEQKWNIILVGESGVGKTSMVQRYVNNKFSNILSATIAVDHFFKDIDVHGTRIRLVVWDSAGQEIYKSIVPQYFRKADGCILVYDVTNMTTFHKLSGWLSEFRSFNEKAPVIIAGNKNEDPNKQSVSVSVVKSYAQQEDMEFLGCSAMTGQDVEGVFDLLVEKMWECRMGPVQPNTNGSKTASPVNFQVIRSQSSSPSADYSILSSSPQNAELSTNDQPISLTDNPAYYSRVEKKKKKGCC